MVLKVNTISGPLDRLTGSSRRDTAWKRMVQLLCLSIIVGLASFQVFMMDVRSMETSSLFQNWGIRESTPSIGNIQHRGKGAIVLLAPQRNEGSLWNIDRFCMLLRAVRSIDQHWSSTQFGGYPIYILLARDYEMDPKGLDGQYTEADQALMRQWAPNSTIHFIPIELYSGGALEPNTTREQILDWREGKDGSVAGRDLGYTSMCRLWSGRLQSMSFLDGYKYYLRMDDDSLLTRDVPYDPFVEMDKKGLTYAYRRHAGDQWGIQKLWEVTRPYVDIAMIQNGSLPFVSRHEDYTGSQPYNNFHVARVDFWRSKIWRRVWKDYNDHHLFYKHRVGDANVHAMALVLMVQESYKYEVWPRFPYVHNSNDDSRFSREGKAWAEECQRDYEIYLKRK